MTGPSRTSQPDDGVADSGLPDAWPVEAAAEDGALIARAKAGDLEAFNLIVERYERVVHAACWRILHDQMLAEDAAQDTFVRAWNAISSFQGENARPWLLRIATNRCLDLIRQRNRQATGSLDEQLTEQEPRWSTLSPPELPEKEFEKLELSDRLEAALTRLPEDQRVAIVLADALGYDYSEVASITGSAIGTVKSRISRGRGRLRAMLLQDAAAREHFQHLVRQRE